MGFFYSKIKIQYLFKEKIFKGSIRKTNYILKNKILKNPAKICDCAIRIIVFLLFFYMMYSGYDKPSFNSYYGPGNAEYFEKNPFPLPIHGNPGDYGLSILVGAVSAAGKLISQTLFGADFIVSSRTGVYILFWLYMLTALLFLLPNIPLPVSLGGVMAFYIILTKVAYSLGPSYFRWIPAWSIILCSMFLISEFIIKKDFLGWIYLIGLSLIIGHLHFLRQESKIIPYGMVLSVLSIVWFITLVSKIYSKKSDAGYIYRKKFLPVAMRITLFSSILIGMLILQQEAVRYGLSRAYNTPYKSTKMVQHGKGNPLHCGLGWVSNPYNILWHDFSSNFNYLMFTVGEYEKQKPFDDRLMQEWFKIVKESPALLIRNVLSKAKFLHNFLLNQKIDERNFEEFNSATRTSKLFTWLYIYLIFFMAGLLLLIFLCGKEIFIVQLFGFLGISAGGIVGSLLCHPGYPNGFYGVCIASFFIVTPGIYVFFSKRYGSVFNSESKYIFSKIIRLMLIIFIFILIFLASFTGYKSYKNYAFASKFVTGDPYIDIQKYEYNYSIFFNQLSREKQEIIINKLKNAKGDGMAVRKEHKQGNLNIFKPEILFFSVNQVHLIAFMGKDWTEPPRKINQGHFHSSIVISRDNNDIEEVFVFYFPTDNTYVFNFVNDFDWLDKYRMYSIPITRQGFTEAESYLVAARKISSLKIVRPDGWPHNAGKYETKLISSTRFFLNNESALKSK